MLWISCFFVFFKKFFDLSVVKVESKRGDFVEKWWIVV